MSWRSSTPFGELLREWRTRRRLTQAVLAQALGAHRNTISRWERGEGLPETKGLVLELARVLRLEELETRQLLEASLTALAPYWTVPFRRNPAFTGRDALLQHLQTCLAPTQPGALPQAIALCGLGGIGKTHLAVEHAYRTALEYRAVFWLAAETAESLITSVQQIAEHLQLTERQVSEQSQVVAAVQRWLTRNPGWLIIADNVEDPAVLQAVLPSTRHGALLLTTRQQTLGTLAEALDVPPLSWEEGTSLLLKRAQRVGLPLSRAEETTAAEVVTLLEGLPLALDQAGAYLDETHCSIGEYLLRYQQQRGLVLARRGIHGGVHPASVATTMGLSVNQIEQDHPEAADLLRLCAFLHPEAIPEELLSTGMAPGGSVPGGPGRDAYHFDQTLAALRSASLVGRDPESRTLTLHRLVQAVLEDQMEPAERRCWSERALVLVNAAFPRGGVDTWKRCERYLTHALVCLSRRTEIGNNRCETSELLMKVGSYLLARGRLREAEPLLEQAVTFETQHETPNSPALLTALANQAELFQKQGKYEQAKALWRRVLALEEQQLEPAPLQRAEAFNNLAVVYWSQGQYEQAWPLYEDARALRERHLGHEHLLVAESLSNLALLAYSQGQYEQAESLFLQALEIQEHQGRSPEMILMRKGLAQVYRKQGKYAAAESLCQQALRQQEQQVGRAHPATALLLKDLAWLSRDQGQYAQAEALFHQALHLHEQQLGLEHPATALILTGLGQVAQDQGQYALAETYYRRVVALAEQHRGQHYPGHAEILHQLARLAHRQGRSEQAISWYQQALVLSEHHLGSTHPQTADMRQEYQCLLEQHSQAAEREPGERRVSLPPAPREWEPPSPGSVGGEPSGAQRASDPLHAFVAACCVQHPHAWCQARELWQAYQHWSILQQDPFPLSRRALTAALKGQGFQPARTNRARFWRGIALQRKP